MFEPARREMVEAQLAHRGITDPLVLAAFRAVPREEFVPRELERYAHHDKPLPIGYGQTISQPYIVAVTVEALRLHGGERVLEVGTGSGYAAAVLAEIAGEVYTIESVLELGEDARRRLELLSYGNVHVAIGDGTLGWPAHAPYDAIAVAAAGPKVPRALLEQLVPGGRLVMPVGPSDGTQELVRVTRTMSGRFETEHLMDVQFVPLIGQEGWPSNAGR